MNISEALDRARLASQRAEETPSDPGLALHAARCWDDLASTANDLADTWKERAAVRRNENG